MVFACQRNSFLTEFKTVVLSCILSNEHGFISGGKKIDNGYDVILEDTILFPEGGGQPCDFGYINDIRVENVRRVGDKAVHLVEKPLVEGQDVLLKVDWDRRFDHMQQHSGQHLITAVAEKLGYPTSSWWLGQEISFVELETNDLKQEAINKIEREVNEYIRNGTRVTVDEYSENNPIPEGVTTRGLPKDHKGDIRVVTIESLESNMCCGTHVTSLSQLQLVKLVKAEKGKKGKMNLEFLVGERVTKQLATMYQREQKLSTLLNSGPQQHVELVGKLQKSVKISSKNLQLTLKELAVFEAKALLSKIPKPKYYVLHRQEADSNFMSTFIREVNDTEILLFLTVGEDKGTGQMILHGNPEIIANIGSKICDLLEGKGAGKGTRFQAKVNNLSKRNEVAELIKNYFNSSEKQHET